MTDHTGPSHSLVEQIEINLVESGLDIASTGYVHLVDEVVEQLVRLWKITLPHGSRGWDAVDARARSIATLLQRRSA